ncbi:hypothetical protein JOC95_000236 [Bacillus tianshenii]|uniref:Uncharacterized protein n=1 Tax=Sutcliffiella tianshenii TaxID=1463404 RepID=A0ABS2NUS5_9BACI|nr:hypothetical protein [Bacillus tianshenii]MBM7618394.1 hypothetical protein [Bacillus tianshenii]
MQKYIFLLALSCLMMVVSGCAKSEQNGMASDTATNKKTQEQATHEADSTDIKEKEEEGKEENAAKENSAEDQTDETESTEVSGLEVYLPKIGMEKKFTDGVEILVSEKVVAQKGEFIQMATTIGGNTSFQVYKWTDDEITLVFEEESVDNPAQNILDSFTPMDNPQVIITLQDAVIGDWEIIEIGSEVEVAYGTFENVYVVQKITDEIEGADTIYTRYYAPGVGLVKESLEVTGENGYKGETELATIEN